jgi:dCMP deaminase
MDNSRESWDDYFLGIAKLVSTRSRDESTKHGTVLVKNRRILSTGVNGPLSNIDDSQVPQTRPDKYFWFIHSEINALLFCNEDLTGATAYITGQPCAKCFVALAQKNVSRIVYGDLMAKCISEEEISHINKMAKLKNVELVKIKNDYEKFNGSEIDSKYFGINKK